MLAAALPKRLGRSAMSVSSHAGDGATVARCHCRVMRAMALLRGLGRGAMLLPSHAGDGAAKMRHAVRLDS
jgi:hypothetical protein